MFQKQETDREELAISNARITRENARIRENIKALEEELHTYRDITERLSPMHLKRIHETSFKGNELDHTPAPHPKYLEYADRERTLIEKISSLKKKLESDRKTTK